MHHTAEWNIHVDLTEEEGTTRARAVLDTGAESLRGDGLARRNPIDRDVPEIGDELAAGRAMRDLAQQLLHSADRDIAGMNRSAEPTPPWPV